MALFGGLGGSLGCGPPPAAMLDGGTTTHGGATSVEGSSEDEDDPIDETSDDSTTSGPGPTTDHTGFVPDNEPDQLHVCNMFEQDCPEGQKCVPYGSTGGNWDSNKCVPILGDQAPGEPCQYGGTFEATDDCDGTSYCWDVRDVDGEQIGTCVEICGGSADDPQCPPGSACILSGEGSIAHCVYQCNPLLQDCDEGLACYWVGSGFNCVFTTQDIPLGEACGFINDCAGGLMCLNAEVLPDCDGGACCGSFCDTDVGDGPCEAALPGTVCANFFEDGMAPPGFENIGVCILPGF